MSENINVPMKFFVSVMLLLNHLDNCPLESHQTSENIQEVRNYLRAEINAKLDKLERRELYTKYKTAPTEKEREYFRQNYLDKIGMNEDWIWSNDK